MVSVFFSVTFLQPFPPKILTQSDPPSCCLSVADIRQQIAVEWLQIAQRSQWRAYIGNHHRSFEWCHQRLLRPLLPLKWDSKCTPSDQLRDASCHLANTVEDIDKSLMMSPFAKLLHGHCRYWELLLFGCCRVGDVWRWRSWSATTRREIWLWETYWVMRLFITSEESAGHGCYSQKHVEHCDKALEAGGVEKH